MKTRITSLLLTVSVLALLFLSGCGDTQEPGATQTASQESEDAQTAQAEETTEGTSAQTEPITSETEVQYTQLFEKDSVIDIYIEIAEEDWQATLDDPIAEQYYSANATIDGNEIENVGIRTKGNSSLSTVADSDSDRYSFRIKFDKYVKGQTLLGLDELVLNNGMSDPSYMREYLTYEALSELGADTPYTVYANVYINGELFGFYLCVEAIDDSFIERISDTAESLELYKPGDENCNLTTDVGTGGFEHKIGDDTEMVQLQELIDILNSMPEGEKGDIESILDVDSVLMGIAVNTALGSYDSYNGSMAHNYFLVAADGVFKFICWDYNMSFGGFMETGSSTTIQIDEPVMNISLEYRPLIVNLLAVDEYKERYHEYLQQLVDWYDGFEDRVTELAVIIRPYVEADPTAFYTIDEFEAAIVASEEGISESSGFPMPQTDFSEMQEGQMPGSEGIVVAPDTVMPDGDTASQTPGDGNTRQAPDWQNDTENQWTPGDFGGRGAVIGGGNGMLNGNQVSIIDYALARAENIRQQLAGELETTGNPYATGSGMGGGRGGDWSDFQMPEGGFQMPESGFSGDWSGEMPSGEASAVPEETEQPAV